MELIKPKVFPTCICIYKMQDIVIDSFSQLPREPTCIVYLDVRCPRHKLVRYHLGHIGSEYKDAGGISIELLRMLECQIMRGEISVKDRLDFVDSE
jgi:hypothetical protein